MAELDLSTLTTEQQIAALYIGYYDRAGEPDGSTFWENTLEADNAFGLASIASNFAVQQETLDAHPFFTDPTAGAANAFITDLYINLFNRQVDDAGLTFWSNILTGVINGETFDSTGDGNDDIAEVGDIILAIIQGAQDAEDGDQDKTAILNKIEVATSWTDAAEAAGATAAWDELDEGIQNSAKSIIEGVDENESTVTEAKATIESEFAPGEPEPVPGNDIFLTSATDVVGRSEGNTDEATDDNDTFWGYIAQNPFAGGVSNSLSSADRLDGQGGDDRLYAEMTPEFLGATSDGVTIDVQPKLTSIETIELEARDGAAGSSTIDMNVFNRLFSETFEPGVFVPGQTIDVTEFANAVIAESGGTSVDPDAEFFIDVPPTDIEGFFSSEQLFASLNGQLQAVVDVPEIVFDAKDSYGIDSIGSKNSDGDLVVENLNTLENEGDAVGRKTADMTITMDHTDNFNSDGDASDLTVYFDENYLLANDPVESGALLTIELMDLDAETVGDDPLLDNPFGAITFTFDGETKELNFGTDSNTYAELLADIQEAIDLAAQTDSDFEQLSASIGEDFTVRDTDKDPNPARPPLTGQTIVITNSGPEILEAENMVPTGVQPAGKDFHTGFDNEGPDEENFKIEVDIDLHKVGRGGNGGDLVVGGKDQEVGQGIHVFNVDVLGAGEEDPNGAPSKPSNLGTLTSTNGDLQTINIETHADFVDGDTHASLTIRDGFNHVGRFGETGDLMMVNANDFLGDLTLGTGQPIINLDTLTALGGGDVTFVGRLDGTERDTDTLGNGQDYTYLTGAGEDVVNVTIDGDALDFANSGLEIKTGENGDTINVDLAIRVGSDFNDENEQLNQAILDNVDIDGEAGDDTIYVDGVGNANIDGSGGNDIIYTDGDPARGFDEAGDLVDSGPFTSTRDTDKAIWAFNFDNERADAQTLSTIAPDELPGVQESLAYLDGARVTVTLSGAGTGLAADGGGVMALPTAGAVQGDDGYEASFTIRDILGDNEYFGTQRDVNEAVIKAIEDDAVLDALLSVEVAANNTLVITSKTSGDFEPEDLRIDIQHGRANSSSYANDVLDEARDLFSDSSLTLGDLWGGTSFSSARSYETDGSAPGVVFDSSADTNAWYDGLSVRGDDNSADDNLHTDGGASNSETDNVINGGNDNDIIVLSTDAVANTPLAYTDDADAIGDNNNAMINGASNETVVMEGDDFGNDTVMNFSTAVAMETTEDSPITQTIGEITKEVEGEEGAPARDALPLDLEQLAGRASLTTVLFDGVTVEVEAGATEEQILDDILAAFADASPSGYTAEVDPDDDGVVFFFNDEIDVSTVTNDDIDPSFVEFEAVEELDAGDPTPACFEVTFEDEMLGNLETDGVIFILGEEITVNVDDEAADIATAVETAFGSDADWTVTATDGVVTFESTATNGGTLPDFDTDDFEFDLAGVEDVVVENIAPGLDFLDFTDYLTSQFDSSSNPPGSDSTDSNVMIPVTLDYGETNTLGNNGDGSADADVEANEVGVVTMAGDSSDSEGWGGLSASNVEDLFNNDGSFTGFGGDSSYGDLDAANFDVATYQTSDQEALVGDAKAIFMVENAGNDGDYKVFELTWDGDNSSDADNSVSAEEIGQLDFGTSLTGLDDVNLVGSEDYATLVADGILNYG